MKKLVFLFTFCLLLVSMAWGQTYLLQEGFSTTSLPSGWSGDVYFNDTANTGNLPGANGAGFNRNNKYLQLPSLSNVGTLTFWMKGSDATSKISMKIQKSVGGGAFADIATFPKPHTTTSSQFSVLVNDSSSNVVLQFVAYDRTGNSLYLDDIEVTAMSASPVIALSPTSLPGFTYVYGNGPSDEQNFTVSGSNLTANISISAPTNFEISTDTGVSFSATSPITLTQSGGAVGSTTIYVRLKAGRAVGAYNNENITITSTGADSKTVTCSGEVTTPAAPSAPLATAATVLGSDSFTANWNSVSGATGYYLDVYTKSAGGNASDLFISEYIEGSSNNKYIEIFNGTGASVDLSGYKLELFPNGASTANPSVALSGTLANGNCIVYKNSGAALTLPDGVTATDNTAVNFNGDDAIALYKNSTSSYVDIFGRIGDDPGTAWTGSGGYTTVDKTLVRKAGVNQGVSVNPSGTGPSAFTTLTTEWDMYNVDTSTYLGSHTFSGGESIEFVSGFEDLDVENVTYYSVTGLSPGTTYYYVVRAYNTSGTSANSNEIEVETTSPSATITTGAVSTPPFYVDSATSASGTVAYTSTGTFSGATFTAKLSDASGSFASPTNIGTSGSITGSNPSGSINITIPIGTAEGSGYKIRIDCASPSITGSVSSDFSIQNGAKNVTGVSSTVDSGSLTVSWTNPTTIYDEIMIVAKASASISGTPSGDGSSYTASLAYGSGTAFDSGYVVYKGATSPQTITNLTNQTTYYVKVFTRKNSNWSSGVEINNTPAVQPALVDIIVPQYMQGLNGTNNQRIPTAFRFRLDNLTPSATYRYYGRFIQSTDIATYTGAGIGWFVNSDNTFTRSDVLSYTTTGQYSEFTTDATGSYTGWFMGEPSGNVRFTPGNDLWFRIMLNDGADGTAVETILTSASAIKVINFGTQENVNQGTFLRGVSQSPAKNFIFVYDNEAGTGRPISGTVVESDGLDLSGVTQILPLYKNNVDAIAGAWGLIIPNSVGSKGFTGIKRIESRNLSDANIYGEATDSDGVWPSGTDTTDPTGGDDVSEHLVMGSGDATLPVELSSFTVALNAYNAAVLTWVTQTETGVNGFYILRGATDQLIDAAMVSDLIPATNTSQTQVYTYRDSELFGTGTYYYWLNVNDMDGSESFHGPITLVYQTGDNPTPTIPKLTELKSIYPNPFNPSANISYGLATPAEVEFRIYNSRGQMVRNMALGMKDAGTWNLVWNGTDNSGQTVPTGVYYIRMQAGKDSFMRKAVMMK